MLHRREGCTCNTGAIPVGLWLRTGSQGPDLLVDVRGSLCRRLAEVQLQTNNLGPRCSVDDDSRRVNDAATTMFEKPLEPELNVVSAPGAVVAGVSQRQLKAGRVLAAHEVHALDLSTRLLQRSGNF